jgi:hypothetical protein
MNGLSVNTDLEKELKKETPDAHDPFRTIQASNPHVPFQEPKGHVKITYFGPALIALNREIENHGKLRMDLAMQHAHEWETRLGVVAAYCGVVMNGHFSVEEIEKLAGVLTKILYQKRLEDIIH